MGPVQWPVGTFQLSFPPWLKAVVTPLSIVMAMQNKKCKKKDSLTFLIVSENISFLMKKVDMYFIKRAYCSLT